MVAKVKRTSCQGSEGSSPATHCLDPPARLAPICTHCRLRRTEPHLEGETVESGAWSYARPRELLRFLLLHPHLRDTISPCEPP